MEESERKDEKERAGVALEQAGQARCGLHDLLALSFSLQEKDWKLYSALPLAFLGDAVFSLMVRSILVQRQNMQVNKLHRISCALVSAPVQARMGKAIYLYLTEQEKAIFRRGRNAKPEHGAKNASRKDYLEATALETLFGFLYLEHDEERIVQLFVTGLKETGYVI